MKTSLERLKLTVKKQNKANMSLLSFITSSLVRRLAQTNHSKLADVSTNQDKKPKPCFVPVATASFPALGTGLHDLRHLFLRFEQVTRLRREYCASHRLHLPTGYTCCCCCFFFFSLSSDWFILIHVRCN